MEQILPQTKTGQVTRAGIAVLMKLGLDYSRVSKVEVEDEGGKGLIQTVVVKLNESIYLAGIYANPQTKRELLETTIDKIRGTNGRRTILTGEINGRHKAWDKITNNRGRYLVKLPKKWNLKITGTRSPSYNVRGRAGSSHPDLIIYTEAVEATQPTNGIWKEASDHTLILYGIQDVSLRQGIDRISKSML